MATTQLPSSDFTSLMLEVLVNGEVLRPQVRVRNSLAASAGPDFAAVTEKQLHGALAALCKDRWGEGALTGGPLVFRYAPSAPKWEAPAGARAAPSVAVCLPMSETQVQTVEDAIARHKKAAGAFGWASHPDDAHGRGAAVADICRDWLYAILPARERPKPPPLPEPQGIRTGDVVQLKSGGPLMTVSAIISPDARVHFFDRESQPVTMLLPLAALKRAQQQQG